MPPSNEMTWAVTRFFDRDDLDFFMRPNTAVSPEKLKARKAMFDRDHLVLEAGLIDGRGIIRRLLEATWFRAIGPGNAVELPRLVEEPYAAILDFVRDCMDVTDVAGRAEMLGYGDQIDEFAEPMRAAGYCLIAATREANLRPHPETSARTDGWEGCIV